MKEDHDLALTHALERNIYGMVAQPGQEAVAMMAYYMRQNALSLVEQDIEDLLEGRIKFTPPLIEMEGKGKNETACHAGMVA